jgi:Penicillin-binding protein 5, C-terminal domain.
MVSKNYLKYELNKKGDTVPFSVSVENGEAEGVSLQTTDAVTILLSQEEHKRLEIWPQIPQQITAPVKVEQQLGSLEYRLDGKLLGKLTANRNAVPIQSFLSGGLPAMLTNLSDTN